MRSPLRCLESESSDSFLCLWPVAEDKVIDIDDEAALLLTVLLPLLLLEAACDADLNALSQVIEDTLLEGLAVDEINCVSPFAFAVLVGVGDGERGAGQDLAAAPRLPHFGHGFPLPVLPLADEGVDEKHGDDKDDGENADEKWGMLPRHIT